MNSQHSYLAQLNRKSTAVLNIFFLLPEGSSITPSCILTCNRKHWEIGPIIQWLQACVWGAVMERGHVLRTMLILLSLSTVFTEAYPTLLARPSGTLVASGRCDTEHVRVCAGMFVVSQESRLRRENFTPTEWERQASVWKGEHVCHYVCACVGMRERQRKRKRERETERETERERERERECCVSPWEIMPGHSIHRKTLISPFDKKGIESLFRSQPPTEETAGECYTRVSQHRFRSLSARTNTQFAIISCHLQSDIYSIHTNPPSLKNFKKKNPASVSEVFFTQTLCCFWLFCSFLLIIFVQCFTLFIEGLLYPQDVDSKQSGL